MAAPCHRLQVERAPGAAKQFLSAPRARALIATIKPRDVVGKSRRRLAVELTGELERDLASCSRGGHKHRSGDVVEGSAHASGEHLHVRAAVSVGDCCEVEQPGV